MYDHEIRVCARSQEKYKASHPAQIKRIFRYVNGSCNFRILYSQDTNSILDGYYNTYWVGSVDDRKNTFDECFLIGNYFISWKKNCVSLSTIEYEYQAAKSSCTQLLWMKHMMKECNMEQEVMKLFCDNLSANKIKDSHVIDEVQTNINPLEDK